MRNNFIASPDDVRQMLNVDHDTVLRFEEGDVWTGKCNKEIVGQAQKIAHPTWFYELFS